MLRTCYAKVQNASMYDWNDLRSFLAIAETGSTLAAGRALKVSQTTAARRIAALEASLGLTLFERRQAGYALTPAGEALLERARAVEAAARAFGDAAAGQSRDLRGTVCLTTLEIYAVTILSPILRDLHETYPDIRIELDTSEEVRDLAGGQADVALRGGKAPSGGGGLVGRRLVADPWTLYCSRSYAASHVKPRTREELRAHVFVGGGGSVWPRYRAWLRRYELEEAVAMHHGSALGLLAAVRDGFGLAVLPSFVADRDPDLVRCLDPMPDDDHGLWLMTHERLRHTPRVRAVIDFLADRLTRLAREERSQEPAAWATA